MPLLPDTEAEALWKHVLDHWEDDAAHAVFLEHCQRTGQLAEAAARYRGMTGDRDRGAVAQKRLQGVATLALLTLEANRTSPAESARNARGLVLIVVLLAASIAVSLYVLVR